MSDDNDWQAFLQFDFNHAYFNPNAGMNSGEDTDNDMSGSDDDSEAEFDLVNPIVGEMFAFMQRHYDKQPMRTSILSGSGYMDEVNDGNPAQCHEMFHMTLPLFLHLMDDLKQHGYLREGKGDVNVQQAVAMFLYIIGHNTSMRCVADRFPHSTETVCRQFRKVLQAVHSYGKHLIKPDPTTVGLPVHLQVNKYYPWFECPASFKPNDGVQEPKEHYNHKCHVSCDHDMRFTYVHSGWEGSANDSRVLEEVIGDPKHGFPWPPTGSYYLVDSGYPIGTSFLPPHKSTRYHAQEFRAINRRPASKKELYNYRHSSLRMVIEQSFGVLKAHFPILNLMPNFKPLRQRYVIVACCALHNFIRINNRNDTMFNSWQNVDMERKTTEGRSSTSSSAPESSTTRRHLVEMSDEAKRVMSQFRDQMTDTMWADYMARGH
ncbi:hypothetical protein SO802_010504 [Lithocarpus litseifolius]|uniref:DDE Tnp4 domain-containing protein n=1 Tax=Lithocarpus litseifolius TaxID=425828 RepID=A0AAW2DGN0_9ROSI